MLNSQPSAIKKRSRTLSESDFSDSGGSVSGSGRKSRRSQFMKPSGNCARASRVLRSIVSLLCEAYHSLMNQSRLNCLATTIVCACIYHLSHAHVSNVSCLWTRSKSVFFVVFTANWQSQNERSSHGHCFIFWQFLRFYPTAQTCFGSCLDEVSHLFCEYIFYCCNN